MWIVLYTDLVFICFLHFKVVFVLRICLIYVQWFPSITELFLHECIQIYCIFTFHIFFYILHHSLHSSISKHGWDYFLNGFLNLFSPIFGVWVFYLSAPKYDFCFIYVECRDPWVNCMFWIICLLQEPSKHLWPRVPVPTDYCSYECASSFRKSYLISKRILFKLQHNNFIPTF